MQPLVVVAVEKSSVLGTTGNEVVVVSREQSGALFRAIIELAKDMDKGNKRGAIGRTNAEQQRNKGKALTKIIDNLKTLPQKGNRVSINEYLKGGRYLIEVCMCYVNPSIAKSYVNVSGIMLRFPSWSKDAGYLRSTVITSD